MAEINTDIAQNIDIIARASDSFNLNVNITNSDESSFDLTGYKIYFEVKTAAQGTLLVGLTNDTDSPYSDSGSLYNTSAISLNTPTEGKITISETGSSMDITKGTYKYTLRLKSSSGSIKTWMYGKFKLNSD
jgi:hypothetical protein